MAPSQDASPRYKKQRKLVRWDQEKRERAMMALIQDASQRGLDLRWDQAAKQVDPDCSGDALKQQLNKRREKIAAEGASVSPRTSSRASRTHRIISPTSKARDDASHNPLKRERESTNEGDEELETKIKRYGDGDESIDDGATEESDGSDWASKKPPKKRTRKVISGQGSKTTRMSFSNSKGTTASESVKNNNGNMSGNQSTGESEEFDQSQHNSDDLAHGTEPTEGDKQANVTTENAKLKKSLIVALKIGGGKSINLADHPELTKFDRYNYANLPYPSDLTNTQKTAIYNANPTFTLACGNKDDIRLNNFGTRGYKNGMPSINQVLNSTTNNQFPGFSMMPTTQNAPIGPGYTEMLSQTPHYQSMINNTDLLNNALEIGQNNSTMPHFQSTSSGYTNPEYFQQGLDSDLTSGLLPFQSSSFSTPSTNRNLLGCNAFDTDRTNEFHFTRFPAPMFGDEFKATGESSHGSSVANRFDKAESIGSFGNLKPQIDTTIPPSSHENMMDTGASVLVTMSPTNMTLSTPSDSPQSPVPKIEADQERQDGAFTMLNPSLDGFNMDSFSETQFDETNWVSFED